MGSPVSKKQPRGELKRNSLLENDVRGDSDDNVIRFNNLLFLETYICANLCPYNKN